MTGLKRSNKYSFNNSMLKLWSQNGDYIQSWLATVLSRGQYQKIKMELKRIMGNKGYKRKVLHLWKSRNAKEGEKLKRKGEEKAKNWVPTAVEKCREGMKKEARG